METFWQKIFGTSGGSLLELWTSVDGTHPLVAIVSTLSTALLVGLAVVAVYTLVSALIDTMRTGKPGGEVATVWSVIRMVVSLFGLLPIFGGYSAFSLVVLTTAYSASWLGDQVMTPYSEHVAALESDASGEAYAQAIGKLRAGDAERTVQSLYQAALCASAMNKTTAGTENPVLVSATALTPERVLDEKTGVYSYKAKVSYGSPYGDIATDACGSVDIDVATNSGGENLSGEIIAQTRAQDLYNATIAAQVATQSLADEMMADPNMPQERVESRLAAITEEYLQRDLDSKVQVVRFADNYVKSRMQYVAADVGAAGWMLAGGWYFDLAKTYQSVNTTIGTGPQVRYPDVRNFSGSQTYDLSNVVDAIRAGGEVGFWDKVALATSPYDTMTSIFTRMFTGGQSIVSDWMQMYLSSSGADPVRSMQNLGFQMLVIVEIMYGATIVARGLVATLKDVDLMPGFDSGIMSGVFQVVMDVSSPFMATWWTLFGFAVALAYYLPLIPAILFTIAVLSWLLDVVEGILAAGFFAITNAMPDGVGFFSSRGQSVIGMLLGILIKPLVMVAALIMTVYIMDFGTRIMVKGFDLARSDAFQLYNVGLISAIALFAIFVIIMLILARKVFGMIVTIPEAVAQWVGAQFAGRGDEQSLGEIESRFGFAGAVQSMFGKRGGPRKPRNNNRNKGGGGGPAPAATTP